MCAACFRNPHGIGTSTVLVLFSRVCVVQVEQSNSELCVSVDAVALSGCVCFENQNQNGNSNGHSNGNGNRSPPAARRSSCRGLPVWLELFGRQLTDDGVGAAVAPRLARRCRSTTDAPLHINQQPHAEQHVQPERASRVQRLELVDRTLFQYWLLAKFRLEFI